ncbi:MAG: hypothetical protein ACD_46C00220G0005 [uncultured bacterium]|nr:MAG: hypothetical protein ACD_46C00220G0005 [uncultured bacterium]
MIIFQLFVVILLLPLTLLMLVFFNLYLLHWGSLLLISMFFLIYSVFWGLLFFNTSVIVFVFVSLAILYFIRMRYLTAEKNYPHVRGDIKIKKYKFHIAFLFPLSFLKIFNLVPGLSKKIAKKTGYDIDMPNLMDFIMSHCAGTRIDITNNETEIQFEIQ